MLGGNSCCGLFEQRPNPIIEGNPRYILYKYFFNRKVAFLKEAHAVALFPGGFGTLDEALETLTLVQTGKRYSLPLVLIDEPGGTYWSQCLEFFETGLIFHSRLITTAGNKRLSQYYQGIQYNLLRYHVFQGSENLNPQVKIGHSDMAEMLAKGQYLKAKNYLLDHIESHAEIIRKNIDHIEKHAKQHIKLL